MVEVTKMLARLIALVASLAPAGLHASMYVAPDASAGMAARMVCEAYTLGSGNLMLMVGFLVAVYGLYLMIASASYKGGIFLMIFGAIMTALPGLIITFLMATSTFLYQQGLALTDYSTMIEAPILHAGNCNSIEVDLSAYDAQQAGYYGEGNAYSQGMPDIAGAQRMKATSGGVDRSSYQPGACNKGASNGLKVVLNNSAANITSCFGPRPAVAARCRAQGKRCSDFHGGVDIVPGSGGVKTITPAAAGTVKSAGWSGCYGNRVEIDHGGQLTTYSHLAGRPTVTVGDAVAPNKSLGIMGTSSSGNCSTGVHLHFEVRNAAGKSVDPCGSGIVSCN